MGGPEEEQIENLLVVEEAVLEELEDQQFQHL
jgi:hypothetical protein